MRWVAYLDDNELLRSLVQQLLETALHVKCLGAKNLEEFKVLIKESPPLSLTILDINLGELEPTGVDAYHWLRAEGYQAPIVFLTGYTITDPLVRLAQATGAPILEKPIQGLVFIEFLRDLMSSEEGADIGTRL